MIQIKGEYDRFTRDGLCLVVPSPHGSSRVFWLCLSIVWVRGLRRKWAWFPFRWPWKIIRARAHPIKFIYSDVA